MLFALLVHVVAVFAERLPVAPIPKPPEVSTVRNDVVNHGIGSPKRLAAQSAERMLGQEMPPGFLPSCTVHAVEPAHTPTP